MHNEYPMISLCTLTRVLQAVHLQATRSRGHCYQATIRIVNPDLAVHNGLGLYKLTVPGYSPTMENYIYIALDHCVQLNTDLQSGL